MTSKIDTDVVNDVPRLERIFSQIQAKNRGLYTDTLKEPSDWGLLASHDTDQALFEELCFQLFGAGFSRAVVRQR